MTGPMAEALVQSGRNQTLLAFLDATRTLEVDALPEAERLAVREFVVNVSRRLLLQMGYDVPPRKD